MNNHYLSRQAEKLNHINADLRKQLANERASYIIMSAVAATGWACFVAAMFFV